MSHAVMIETHHGNTITAITIPDGSHEAFKRIYTQGYLDALSEVDVKLNTALRRCKSDL